MGFVASARLRSAAFAAGVSLTFGAVGLVRANEWDEGPWAGDDDGAEPVNLGTVEAPSAGAQGQSSNHRWRARDVRPSRHLLDYRLDETTRQYVAEGFGTILREFVTSTRFECNMLPQCVYVQVMKDSAPSLEPLVLRLSERIREAGLNASQTADLITTMVQTIPYEIPSEFQIDLRPPSLVMSQHAGDCDSKSLLLVYLARRLGIGAQILLSVAHGHAVAALAVPAHGVTKQFEGTTYALVESTAEVAIGFMDPRFLRPDDWFVAPLEWPEVGGPAELGPAPPPGPAPDLGKAMLFASAGSCSSCAAITGWFSARGVPTDILPPAATLEEAWSTGKRPGPPVVVWEDSTFYAPTPNQLETALVRLRARLPSETAVPPVSPSVPAVPNGEAPSSAP